MTGPVTPLRLLFLVAVGFMLGELLKSMRVFR